MAVGAAGGLGFLHQIVRQVQNVGHPVHGREHGLPAGPDRRKLAERIVEGADVEDVADQQAHSQFVAADQVDAERQDQDLGGAGGQGVERLEQARGHARRHRGPVVVLVGGAELLAEIVAAVERQDHLEVGQALADVGREGAKTVHARAAGPLHPGRQEAGDDQHARRGNQGDDAHLPIEGQQKHARSHAQEQVAEHLHQRLGEEVVDLLGVAVDPGDQVAGAVLGEEGDR